MSHYVYIDNNYSFYFSINRKKKKNNLFYDKNTIKEIYPRKLFLYIRMTHIMCVCDEY